jgi:acyl carrier protein phosphodiesterase
MEDTLIVLATASPAFAALAGFFAGAWWSSNRQVQRLDGLLRGETRRTEDDEAIHRALAAIEDQLDRFREEQEFLTRLMADAKAKQVACPSHDAAIGVRVS